MRLRVTPVPFDRLRRLVPALLVVALLGGLGICPCADPAAAAAEEHGCCAPTLAWRDAGGDCCTSEAPTTKPVTQPSTGSTARTLAPADLPALAPVAVAAAGARAVAPPVPFHLILRI